MKLGDDYGLVLPELGVHVVYDVDAGSAHSLQSVGLDEVGRGVVVVARHRVGAIRQDCGR